MADAPKFCWNELETRDVKAAARFYEEVLGWTAHAWDPEDPDRYVNFKAGDDFVAGMLNISGSEFDHIPANWFAYIQVDDIAETVAKTEASGGQILKAPFEVPKVGMMAVIADPTGAAVGLLQTIEGGSM